ncbi:MAG TPA: prolipoprotein diacylglyceryl transferase [Candidatus Magasanikbacteria bacterium]|nr:prolipoprotein diacylglyceryl transferase [Candidatus Magasanikbacteria bacterium]
MIPYFSTTGWQIGLIKIQAWGLLVALGFLIGFFLVWRKIKEQKRSNEVFLDLFVWITAVALIMSRLVYVFFEGREFYWQNPLEIIKIWQGGLSSFGGFLGAALVLIWFFKKKKITWSDLDILSWAFSFAWAVGRSGCFLIHDHLGILNNSFLAINFPEGARLDMALLEIIMLLPWLGLIFWKGEKWFKKPGLLSSGLFLWYGVGRFFLDFFRAQDILIPDSKYGYLTFAQWGCIICIILALIWLRKIKKGRFA